MIGDLLLTGLFLAAAVVFVTWGCLSEEPDR